MKPKEKAKELVDTFRFYQPNNMDGCDQQSRQYRAKQCALICVDEIIEIQYKWCNTDGDAYKYWKEVKQEIEKL